MPTEKIYLRQTQSCYSFKSKQEKIFQDISFLSFNYAKKSKSRKVCRVEISGKSFIGACFLKLCKKCKKCYKNCVVLKTFQK